MSRFTILVLMLLLLNNVFGQQKDSHDTAYYETYPELVTLRTYYSKKFTGFNVDFPQLGGTVLKYAPNTTNNLGVGATYRWATLNLAYGFGFMNPDQGRGNTRYLDLQTHQYFGKWNIDAFGQFYRGYYLRSPELPDYEKYLRPDLDVYEFGLAFQRVFNHEKLSFRAAFLNNEYQKRSAGSFLLGGNMFTGKLDADSTLVPSELDADPGNDYRKLRFLKVGVNAGYVYHLVINKNWFAVASITISLNTGTYRLDAPESFFRETYFSGDLGSRIAIGYNSERFTFSTFYVDQRVQVTGDYRNILNTGNFRFVIAYRIHPPDYLREIFE
ncbi:MAG: DUF4421 domain-containing protein [Cyclobacteriaceae bacterium]